MASFVCTVEYLGSEQDIRIHILEDTFGPPLLGRDFYYLFNLNISQIDSHIRFVNESTLEQFRNKYAYVFEPGLGKFTKGLISIKLKSDNVTPKFFRARPLPFSIRGKVEKELDRLVALEIIEPVDFSPWGTPIVPVIRKDGSIRICGDFKITFNPCIEIDQYPLPKIEELFAKLQGGITFTKLDLSNAYQQVCLDNKAKELVTIATHKGLFRYNRAPFGVASIPAKFQKIVVSLLEGHEGVVVFLDDLLVTGRSHQEHIMRLKF